MNVSQLTTTQLVEAHKAAGYLTNLGPFWDRETTIKIDTLRADLGVAIEDRTQSDLEHRADLRPVTT
jgi:hypothetical protein